MIKKLLSASVLAFLSMNATAQNFSLVYPFSSVTATSGTVDPTPTPTAVGVVSGSFTANGLSANPTTTNVFAFTTWPTGGQNGVDTYSAHTGTVDPAKFFEVIITPAGGYNITLTDMHFYMQRSATGPRTWVVRTNKDSYTANMQATAQGFGTGTVVTTPTNNVFYWSADAGTSFTGYNVCKVNFDAPNHANQTSATNIRFYAYNAESGAGSFRVDSVGINGTANLTNGIGTLSHDLNSTFKLYPNPSNDGVVTLESARSFDKIEVINILGAVVAKQTAIEAEKITLNLSSIPAGTYFVRTTNGTSITTEKLIISK